MDLSAPRQKRLAMLQQSHEQSAHDEPKSSHRKSAKNSFIVGLDEICDFSRSPPEIKDMSELNVAKSLFMIQPFKYDGSFKSREIWPINSKYVDKWDANHVRMPCSPKFVLKDKTPAWPKIKEYLAQLREKCLKRKALLNDLLGTIDNCVQYGYNFDTLTELLRNNYTSAERDNFMFKVLPTMCNLAITVDLTCSEPPSLLRKGSANSLTMSQHQAASLLACAFFCLFPNRSDHDFIKDYDTFQNPNFDGLYKTPSSENIEKLKCILHYFDRIATKIPIGVITFRRCVLETKDNPKWLSSTQTLCNLHITADKKIEEIPNVLQVDFANKYIGGGVLGHGCVQEEIRFSLCPEMLVSLLICEVMEPNECVVLVGCQRYSTYDGYARSFRFTGDFQDQAPRDSWGRKWIHLVAMDALFFRDRTAQYDMKSVDRELTKAFISFRPHKTRIEAQGRFGIATGHWGCGVFNGDKQLKAIIQLAAASQHQRSLIYAALGDRNFVESFTQVYNLLRAHNVTVAGLYKYLQEYSSRFTKEPSFFDFILKKYP